MLTLRFENGVYLYSSKHLKQGWPTYGACAKVGALDDLKWRIVYL